MPSKPLAQQHLMAAAEHGANFPMAKKLRASMSHDQLHDFAVGSEEGKPEHVAHHSPPEAYPTPSLIPSMLKGSSNNITHANTSSLMQSGLNELDATKKAIKLAKGYDNKHERLGKFLHPRKDGKPHGSDIPGVDTLG